MLFIRFQSWQGQRANREVIVLKLALLQNRYNNNLDRALIPRSIRVKAPKKTSILAVTYLPYVKGTSNEMRWELSELRIITIFTAYRRINNTVTEGQMF